jgi:hypothetical protein
MCSPQIRKIFNSILVSLSTYPTTLSLLIIQLAILVALMIQLHFRAPGSLKNMKSFLGQMNGCGQILHILQQLGQLHLSKNPAMVS